MNEDEDYALAMLAKNGRCGVVLFHFCSHSFLISPKSNVELSSSFYNAYFSAVKDNIE